MSYYIIKDGKKILKRKNPLPSGHYFSDPGDLHPTLINPDYEGFRITYGNMVKAIKPTTGGIMDSIEVKGLHDGKMYTSKSKYYQSLKESGNHIIEKGEIKYDKRETQGDYNIKKELRQAVQQHLGS